MRFNYIELAKILSKTRKKSKISMRKLAFAVGVSHTEIARIESGNREAPNVVTIIKMCEALGLNPIIILLKTNFFTIEMLDDLFNTHNQIVNKYDRNNSKIKPDMLYEFANSLENFLSESFFKTRKIIILKTVKVANTIVRIVKNVIMVSKYSCPSQH